MSAYRNLWKLHVTECTLIPSKWVKGTLIHFVYKHYFGLSEDSAVGPHKGFCACLTGACTSSSELNSPRRTIWLCRRLINDVRYIRCSSPIRLTPRTWTAPGHQGRLRLRQ